MAVDVLPDVAVDIVATAGDASVALTWTAPADNGAVIVDYIAEYSTDEGLSWQAYDDGVSADPLMTITGLANGMSYVFHVGAMNEYQQPGDWSSVSNAVTPAGLPEPPTDVVASRGDGSADPGQSRDGHDRCERGPQHRPRQVQSGGEGNHPTEDTG